MNSERHTTKHNFSLKRIVIASIGTVWLATALWHTSKPMPVGTNVQSPLVTMSSEQVQFLYDLTTHNSAGEPVIQQQIFDAVFAAIDEAQRFVVLDFFLLNSDMGTSSSLQRPLSRELADRLLARKRAQSSLQVLLLTDPINDVYGGRPSALLAELEAAGVDVVRTDLRALRDSNALYSAAWRMVPQWLGNSATGGWLPDPFKKDSNITLRSWLSLANFKANHRKVLIADTADGDWVGIVASANPHDASSMHSNVALRFNGALAETALASELDIARMSGWHGELGIAPRIASVESEHSNNATLNAQYLTEQAIRDYLVFNINATDAGDAIDIAMFYLSDRKVVNGLLDAAQRQVRVRLILDPNKDAFGIEKDGVPNRPVAYELVTASNNAIEVRWYRTQGEQFHTKLALIRRSDMLIANLGSANFTRRNIGNFNLEANVQLEMSQSSALAQQFTGYFDRLWTGDPQQGLEFTVPFDMYRDDSKLRYWRYRLMEATGLSTF
jgi:phosphatidylserine/phosphatidylglycerophosphate/cardiolipin synthase-like enzyme